LIPPRKLVVNADDFGFTPDVNQGIVEAHRHGILTATTLMANGDAFDDAARLAREVPSLDVGCHLVLIGGRSLLTGKAMPPTVSTLVSALAKRQLNIHAELEAQIRAIQAAGVHPTHLDTHKHTHLLPPVLDAVARLSDKYSIRWVRRPFDFPMGALAPVVPQTKRLTSRALGLMRSRFHRVLERHGCRTTDHFGGFQLTGHFRTAQLISLIAALPEGSTEFMCHPGRCTDALRGARTRLKESRERELEALLAPEVRDALRTHGIKLVNYREL